MNGITSLENDVMDKTQPLVLHYERDSFIATAFFMTYTCSSDYEIMQLLNTGGVGERSNFKKIPTHTQDHGDA